MISYARQNPEAQSEATPPPAEDHIAPAPRVSVQAFCETVETAAAVQSADPQKAREVAAKLRAGRVAINEGGGDRNTPFGGYKDSGVGRQNGVAGFDQYTEVKSVAYPAV